jgi:hypothetical protein
VLQARERAPTLSPSAIFTFGFVVESIKELGVRQDVSLHSLYACTQIKDETWIKRSKPKNKVSLWIILVIMGKIHMF